MGLEIIKAVREALDAGEQPKVDDVRFLCATADQLWSQVVNHAHEDAGRNAPSVVNRREYMRVYMANRRRREREAQQACGKSPSAPSTTNGSGSGELH